MDQDIVRTHPGRSGARRIPLAGIALVNVATLTWASNMTLGRWLRDDVGPLTLAAVRFLIASSFLAALLTRVPPQERRLGRERWLLAGMALSGVVVFTPTLYLGLRYTTAVNATLINGMGPLITGLFAALLIRERMSGPQLGGAVLGLIGVTALISGGRLRFWESMQGSIGDLIVLAAVTLWAIYSVLGRRAMERRSALSASALSALLGLPLLLTAAAWEMATSDFTLKPRLILPLIYIGIAPGVLGFLSWNAGVRRLGASGAMVYYNTLPLYGALLGHLVLGEPLGLAHLLGGALIVGGGLWAAHPAPPGGGAPRSRRPDRCGAPSRCVAPHERMLTSHAGQDGSVRGRQRSPSSDHLRDKSLAHPPGGAGLTERDAHGIMDGAEVGD